MASNLNKINFRELNQKFLLVKNIDMKTRLTIQFAGFHIRDDDNAMLIYGYIDQEAGMSFEFLCAACIYEDGTVSLEPGDEAKSFKFRYGSFQGDVIPFTNEDQLTPFRQKEQMIQNGYTAPDDVLLVRSFTDLDSSRAPGFPDDLMVFFVKEGFRNEGIWCRTIGVDGEKGVIKMTMLNEPNAPFGKHLGDIIDVGLLEAEDGERVAVAIV